MNSREGRRERRELINNKYEKYENTNKKREADKKTGEGQEQKEKETVINRKKGVKGKSRQKKNKKKR